MTGSLVQPAYALPLPREFGESEGYEMLFVLEIVRCGNLPEPPGGVSHLEMIITPNGQPKKIAFRLSR